MIFNILLYAVMIYMIIRIFTMNKQMKKNRQVISIVSKINEPAEFYAAADEVIYSQEDDRVKNKTKIIKLWGMAYHEDFDEFKDLLDDIDLSVLITDKKGMPDIEENEDSFFYILLAVPNMLYGAGRNDLRQEVEKKVSAYDAQLDHQMVKALSDHCALYYDEKEDLGEQFFRDIDNGDYPGYRYSKQLIGIYKNICDTMLVKILENRNEDTSEYEDFVRSFSRMGVGKRWLKTMGLERLIEEEEQPEEPAEEEKEEETEDTDKENNE